MPAATKNWSPRHRQWPPKTWPRSQGTCRRSSASHLQSLELHHRRRQEAILNFEDGTAGRLMNADVVSVRPDVSLAVVLRWLNSKEIAVGALNDLAWALVIGGIWMIAAEYFAEKQEDRSDILWRVAIAVGIAFTNPRRTTPRKTSSSTTGAAITAVIAVAI